MSCNEWKESVIGRIPYDWEIRTIEDIKSNSKNAIAMGPFGSRIKSENFVSEGVPVIRGVNLSKGKLLEEEYVFLTEEKADELKSSNVFEGDIVFTHRGTLGQVGIIPKDSKYRKYIVSQSQMKLSCNKELVEPEWVYYFFKSKYGQHQLLSNTSTTGVPAIGRPTTTLKLINIPIPPKKEQINVIKILNSLEDKIVINESINKTLEEMAQALFKRWFVDFEFPDENGKPYKSSGGEMVESELGMIPKGWGVKSIDELTDVSIGKTPPRKEKQWFSLNKNDIKWSSIKDLGNCGVYIFNTSEYLTREAIEKFNVKVVPKNTVILSFKLTVGRVAITPNDMVTNEAIAHFKIINKEYLTTEYLYSYLKQFNYESLGNTSSIATAVNSKTIKKMPVISPASVILNRFTSIINGVFQMIKNNESKNIYLEELRDTLLPKLMSGEIRVIDNDK